MIFESKHEMKPDMNAMIWSSWVSSKGLWWISLCFLFLSFSSHAETVDRPEMNILFISADDLNCDISAYGMKEVKAPHLDRLAKMGTVFESKFLSLLPESIEKVLTDDIFADMIEACVGAKTIFFAGRNNGIAEELVLKTNEITRKKSTFFEGTYAIHGIEEVMEADDVLIIIDPFEDEEEKFEQCLQDAVGMTTFAISSRSTRFPTFQIPQSQHYDTVLQLCAGWNLLVEIGLALNIDLDKPERARKVGNEYIAP